MHSFTWTIQALICVLLMVFLVGCDRSPVEEERPGMTRTYSFDESQEGWTGDFVDYPTSDMPQELELVFDRRALPEGLDESEMGLYLAGRNTPDDLFMYVKHEVDDLEPNTTYEVTYELEIASNAPSGCAGIGGAPGEAVVLKVGVSLVEPVPVVQGSHYRLNVDKGNQSDTPSGSSTVRVVGNIANGVEQCTGEVPYRMINRGNADNPLRITTDDDRSLWLFAGTDSGFEGKTTLYYDVIRVTLSPEH